MDIAVLDSPESSRYEIRVEEAVAGFAEYRRKGDVLAVLHTEVDPAYQGRGLAGRLVRDMLADIRERGLQLHPYCPLVHRVIRKDLSSYLDLVPEQARRAFRLPLSSDESASEEGPPAFEG